MPYEHTGHQRPYGFELPQIIQHYHCIVADLFISIYAAVRLAIEADTLATTENKRRTLRRVLMYHNYSLTMVRNWLEYTGELDTSLKLYDAWPELLARIKERNMDLIKVLSSFGTFVPFTVTHLLAPDYLLSVEHPGQIYQLYDSQCVALMNQRNLDAIEYIKKEFIENVTSLTGTERSAYAAMEIHLTTLTEMSNEPREYDLYTDFIKEEMKLGYRFGQQIREVSYMPITIFLHFLTKLIIVFAAHEHVV